MSRGGEQRKGEREQDSEVRSGDDSEIAASRAAKMRGAGEVGKAAPDGIERRYHRLSGSCHNLAGEAEKEKDRPQRDGRKRRGDAWRCIRMQAEGSEKK
eukprot:768417-Hanusia_phi.AAC.3